MDFPSTSQQSTVQQIKQQLLCFEVSIDSRKVVYARDFTQNILYLPIKQIKPILNAVIRNILSIVIG